MLVLFAQEKIREYATGNYAIALADPYLEQARENERTFKFFCARVNESRILVKATGLQVVHLLYDTKSTHTLVDTHCTCDGGLRVIGGCAHAIAILRLLLELKGALPRSSVTKSRKILDIMMGKGELSSDSDELMSGSDSESYSE